MRLAFAVLAAASAGPALAAPVHASPPSTTAPQDTVAQVGCRLAGWPEFARGLPAGLHDASARGYFVWFDTGGWHLRARAVSEPLVGRVTASTVLRVTGHSIRSGDRLTTVSRGVEFSLSAGGTKGFDFRVGCSRTISFSLGTAVPGGAAGMPVARPPVYLGASGHHPPSNLFRLARRGAGASASGVEGWIVVGPNCPVEGGPVACKPSTVQGTVRIESNRGSGQTGTPNISLTVRSDARGFFRAVLPVGTYRLRVVELPSGFPIPPSQRFSVQRGIVTQLKVTIDTGIR